MKRTHLAIGIIGIALTLAAEPVCQRIVFRAAHRHHSKATLASWAEWNKTHIPPKPKDILTELDLACPPMNLAAIDTGDFIPVEVVPVWEPVEFEPDVTVAALDVPDIDNPSVGYVPAPPFVPYGAAVPTPEPWPLGLVLLGAGCLYCCKRGVPRE